MRLIDADALLEQLSKKDSEVHIGLVMHLIDSMPTVQREEQENLAGWVSVPIEPTEEMLMAGCEAGLDTKTLMDDEPFATDKAVYKAMIKTYINK